MTQEKNGFMSLFDRAAFRSRLPENIIVYASGSNRPAEITGFERIGAAIGVSVPHLTEKAIKALSLVNVPVMIDSGAFSEVAETADGLRVVDPITPHEWSARLATYLRLCRSLGSNATVVAPDQVGSQAVTLERLTHYRGELAAIARTGAAILIPLQVGELSHAAFYEQASRAAGVALTPAFPLKKAVTSADEIVNFVLAVKPQRIHLLGMSDANRRAPALVRAILHYAPEISISMDANRIRAVTGQNRPMTQKESVLHDAEIGCFYGNVESPILAALDERMDYTDAIAFPSTWASPEALAAIAEAAGLTAEQAAAFHANPDCFLQEPMPGYGDMAWIEHHAIDCELDRQWEQYVRAHVREHVRSAAIIATFTNTPLSRHCERR